MSSACWLIAIQHLRVLVRPQAFAGGADEGKLANSVGSGSVLERQNGARSSEVGDTVKWLLDTVICSLERPFDTVIAHQDMLFSLSNPCRERSMPEIEAKEPWAEPSNETVDLSVSIRSSVGAGPVLPMSGPSPLTIEWE